MKNKKKLQGDICTINILNRNNKIETVDVCNPNLFIPIATINTINQYIGEYIKEDWNESLDEFQEYLNKAHDIISNISKQHPDSLYHFINEVKE